MKRVCVGLLLVLVGIVVLAAGALAKGPVNAGGNDSVVWNGKWMVQIYIGPDFYGAGTGPTVMADGTKIDADIESLVMMVKVRYFDEADFTSKDWVHLKFWLSSPLELEFPDGSTDVATQFIFIKMRYEEHAYGWHGLYYLQAYR